MPENEFEKQAQQKMEEFRVRPSAEVWTAVEARIREKKRRRFVFWWPLLLLLGGGIAAGIVLLKDRNTKDAPVAAQNKTISKTAATVPQSQVPANNTSGQPATVDTGHNNKPADQPVSPATDNKTNNAAKTTIQNRPLTEKQPPGSLTVKNKIYDQTSARQVISKAGGKKEKRQALPAKQPALAENIPATTPQADEPVMVSTEKLKGEPPLQQVAEDAAADKQAEPDSIVKEKKQDVAVSIASPEKKDSAAQAVTVNIPGTGKKKQVWQKSLTFSLGRSVVTDSTGFGFFRVSNSADAYVSGGGSGIGAGPVTSRFIGPSTVYYSSSFAAGLQLSKPLSRRLELILGAGYTYLSSKIKVGNRIDSNRFISNSLSSNFITRDYFRYDTTGNTRNYHNQYHFVSLSAGFSWRIIQRNKFSLDWVNSLAYKRLLFSSMLHYDRSIPGYYKDNSLLNRNQLFISTGLSVPFSNGLTAGPYFSYGLTHVLKNESGSAIRYANAGIRLSLQLNKNKRRND